MSNLSELNSYIARLQQRLRLGVWLRGAAIFTLSALAVTIALVLVLNRFAFPSYGVIWARVAMFGALAATAGFAIALPLIRLTRERAVREAEGANWELEQRLTTIYETERKGPSAFLELLAADTLARTQGSAPKTLIPDSSLFALGGAGVACLGVLVWMISAGPGYLGYGAALLWTGPAKNVPPLYAISVTPGDIAVRRNSDQLITAHVTGMHPEKVQLYAHYEKATGWEPVAMQGQPDTDGAATYQFVFAGLPENVEYYVAAGPLVSSHYKVRVVDLPTVKNIRVTYRYPKWTGMKPVMEEHSGDLRAIEGTDAALEVALDRPLNDGKLTLDDGQVINLTHGGNNSYLGSIHMQKDGAYHVSATVQAQQVRLSEDYFIATDKAVPPEILIDRPRGDYRASPIEELTVGVKAADQFGLNEVRLHYSVNGGPDHDLSMLKTPGAKSADGSSTLVLEDYKLVPGDLVSVYATARDGHSDARTDISFIQVEPFEREFSQSQQSGGGGGSGGNKNQTEISKREKELIAATWKQQNDKAATPKDAAAAGEFLSDAQQKLRDQVLALSARMQSRDLSAANEEFTDFDKDIQAAASAMAPSADKLKGMQWNAAIPLEQKALQALLRAESTFRKIQVAFGQRGGGGGGGTNSAGRDLASLFDLELDTEKNQYETAQTASPAEQREKEVEAALEKLDALAKRQEELANQQHNPQQSFQERWQQDMLRREAEQLQRQMEQLAKSGQQKAGGSPSEKSGQQGSGGQSGSQSSQQQAGGPSSSQTEQRIEQALSRLRSAGEVMKRNGGLHPSTDAAQRAASQLREATKLLGDTQQQLASGKLDSLTRGAAHLTQEERAQADRINRLASPQGDPSKMDMDSMLARRRELDRLANERQQLSDDLSKLEKNLRDAAREMAPNQPGAARKLREALAEMDDSNLDNRVQRTADWLRRGVNPNSNGTESQIALGLDKLNQQLKAAQQGMGQGKPGARDRTQGDRTAALDQVERLRSQIEAMAGPRSGSGQAPQNGQTQDGQIGQKGTQLSGKGSSQGRAGQPTGDRPGGERGGNGMQRSGDVGGQSGEVRYGSGRGADGTAWGNINTGDNRYGERTQRPAPTDTSRNPPDVQQTYRQGLRKLDQIRQMLRGDTQSEKELEQLARQMRELDPSRFPGNPAMVEQLHREVLSSVDRLELQLRRDGISTEARTGKPLVVPAGYQDSVADYFRRLSKNP